VLIFTARRSKAAKNFIAAHPPWVQFLPQAAGSSNEHHRTLQTLKVVIQNSTCKKLLKYHEVTIVKLRKSWDGLKLPLSCERRPLLSFLNDAEQFGQL